MSSITVTLPDGSTQQVSAGTTPLDIARSISPRLADDAVVARVNGDFFDLTRPLEGDASLQILTSKNPEALEVYRHSTAHLLAAAVLELFPGDQAGHRAADRYGFLLRLPTRAAIHAGRSGEDRSQDVGSPGKRDLPYERKFHGEAEGLKKYQEMGEFMKCELIDEKAGEIFTEYTLGPNFIDFCRGPHVPSTKG